MGSKNNLFYRIAVTAGLVTMTAVSCVYIDENLGSDFVPDDRKFQVATTSFALDNVMSGMSNNLSGYSSSRITVGAIKNGTEWETHGSAFTLIPITAEKPDFGKNRTDIRFHFTAVRDTFSFRDESQKNIIQHIKVQVLEEPIGEDALYTDSHDEIKVDTDFAPVTIGTPTYNGGDSLSFDFSKEFAEYVISRISSDGMTDEVYEDIEKYTEKLPGIYITLEEGDGEPASEGGRINMFELPIKISDSYYVTGNYAELAFTAEYEGRDEPVDTSFLFFFGPQERKTSTTQYAFNVCRHSSQTQFTEKDEYGFYLPKKLESGAQTIVVEGGGGLKPVISAAEIKSKLLENLPKGIDPANIIINKATIVLPIASEFDGTYRDSYRLPQMLNPTSRITGTIENKEEEENEEEKHYITFAGLTDASIESENQGDIDRSLERYAPDVSHHVQTILRLDADASLALSDETSEEAAEARKKFRDYDIWFLIMADETIVKNQDNSYMDDYYQNMAYANYYNSMYNPYGYGGYYGGGYGYGYGGYGYGYGYNNYYNYMAMAQMAQMGSGSTTSKVTQLDKDRYYRCELKRPAATEQDLDGLTEAQKEKALQDVPHMKIIYSYRITSEDK